MFRALRLLLPVFCLVAVPVQAAVFTVTKTADTLDGACDRDCSLREAITAANANLLGDADVVVVPAGIYMLTRTGAGEEENAAGDLDVLGSTILVGTGAGSTVIDGFGSDRVLDLRGPAEIEGVTIRNGRADGDGGGVLVRPDPVRWPVLVHRSVISGNRALGDGGGISAPAIGEWADVEIRESAILENQAGGDGGGFAGIGFQLENVTVSDNRAEGSGGGLAYEAGQGETISSATIVFNQAEVSGGGIHARAPLVPGTFSPQVSASIVAENFAPQGRDCSGLPVSLGYNVLGVGEGCSPQPTDKVGTAEHPLAAVFRVQDTRLGPTPVHALLLNSPASNLVPSQLCEDADQLGQERFEIHCDAGALEQSLVPRCLPGGSVLCLAGIRVTATLDERFPSRGAQAVPLTGNTGYFWFFSPDNLEIQVKVLNGCAVNGHLWFFASGLTDVGVHLQAVDPQTGRTRTYVHKAGTTFPPRLDTSAFPCPPGGGTGSGDGGSILELRSGEVFRVTRASDGHEDGSCDFNCSLREAMTAANARPTTSVIVLGQGLFYLNIPGRDEDLGHVGDLDVTAPLVILGAGANRTVIDGGGNDRVLDVHGTGSLELHGATVRNGRVPEGSLDAFGHGGGGIRSYGPLALVRSWVTASSAGHEGGGVAAHGEIEVRDSTISGNFAGKFGGGLFAAGGGLLENVTLSGNEAGQSGGGALLFGTEPPALDSVTITGNLALDAGGLAVEGGCDFACAIGLTMRRTVIAGNTATLIYPDCVTSANHAGTHNVFGIGVGCNPSPGDLSGTPEQPLDPRLTPLGNHGGPTPTHALLPDSPAIDLAPAASCPGTDQRGRPRPADGDEDGQALCDAGAVERLPGCQPDEETLCLGRPGEIDRFRVTARWTAQGASGPGKAVPLAASTGSFWFFNAANLELTVKVLDGCGLNDRFWVFLSGLTDVGVEVTVEDTATGNTWTHEHAAGTPLQPRLDTEALPCASF